MGSRFLLQGNLPDPGIKARCPAWQADSLSSEPPGKIMLLLLLSCFSRVPLCATPWTAAHRAPPSMGVSRQEYWSGVPLLGIIRDEKLGPSQFCPGCAILLCMFVAFSVLMYV